MPDWVVFDTSIWISSLLWRGKAYQCLLLARAQVVEYEGIRVLSAAEFLARLT